MNDRRELESLAVFVHGALAALHTLGVVYNIRQRNKVDVVVHAAAAIYDFAAARKHWRARAEA